MRKPTDTPGTFVSQPDEQFEVRWIDAGRKANCPSHPDYPDGIACSVAHPGQASCIAKLPYPAPQCGKWFVRCRQCTMTVILTAAGRKDDPNSLTMPCVLKSGGTA